MTETPASPTPIVSFASLEKEESLLASLRPEVMRVRTVYQAEGEAILYIGYPEDTGTNAPLPSMMRSLGLLVANSAATDLSEPSHYPDAQTLPVQVHVFAEELEVEGPSAEVLIDRRGPKPWSMEVVFDGLDNTSGAAYWIVDVLVSAADQLDADSAR